MVSILRRPLDLFIVVTFFLFLLIAVTIGEAKQLIISSYCSHYSFTDLTQSIYGSILSLKDVEGGIWPPPQVVKAYKWWCETYDPLVGHNPMW